MIGSDLHRHLHFFWFECWGKKLDTQHLCTWFYIPIQSEPIRNPNEAGGFKWAALALAQLRGGGRGFTVSTVLLSTRPNLTKTIGYTIVFYRVSIEFYGGIYRNTVMIFSWVCALASVAYKSLKEECPHLVCFFTDCWVSHHCNSIVQILRWHANPAIITNVISHHFILVSVNIIIWSALFQSEKSDGLIRVSSSFERGWNTNSAAFNS